MEKFKWRTLIPGLIAGGIMVIVKDVTGVSFFTLFGAYALGCVALVFSLILGVDDE